MEGTTAKTSEKSGLSESSHGRLLAVTVRVPPLLRGGVRDTSSPASKIASKADRSAARGPCYRRLQAKAMARLNLTLLGGFQGRVGASALLALPTRKAQALLAFLSLPPGRSHPREKLAIRRGAVDLIP